MRLGRFIAKKISHFFFPNAEPAIYYAQNQIANKITPYDVVFILGWGGAHTKSLDKVVNYYNGIGVHAILHVMPLGVPSFLRLYFFFLILFIIEFSSHLSNYPRTFYESRIIDEYHSAQISIGRPLSSICHIYSNNGVNQ